MTAMTTLYVREDSGFREASAQDVLTRAQSLIAQRFRTGTPVLSSPARTHEFLKLKLGGRECEMFCMLALDNRLRLIEFVELFRGTVDGASVHPREVVKEALRLNAAGVILVHNHPSGISVPSQADELITQRLKEALALIDVRVVDHLIVGDTIHSFTESGRL
jgi:DNA repair protein RadC